LCFFPLDDEIDSGRSTPQHLKKYCGTQDDEDEDDVKAEEETNGDASENASDSSKCKEAKTRRARTFSETLKLLDDDILAELDVS